MPSGGWADLAWCAGRARACRSASGRDLDGRRGSRRGSRGQQLGGKNSGLGHFGAKMRPVDAEREVSHGKGEVTLLPAGPHALSS